MALELTNAHLRTHHGVDHVLVRGLAKVTCVPLLAAISSNLPKYEHEYEPDSTAAAPVIDRSPVV